jgi:hypothetical protein
VFQVFLHNSTTTPSPLAYREELRAALADVQAEDLEDIGWFRLRDGAEIQVLTEAEDDICLIEYDRMSDAVAETIFQIMRRTESFVFLPGAYAFRVAGSAGAPVPDFALAFEAMGIGQFANAEDLRDFFAHANAPEAPVEPTEPLASGPRFERSFGQRISDLLFGRPG